MRITMRIWHIACFLSSLVMATWLLLVAALSQTGPTLLETTKYKGLHAAAWKGDAAEILRLGKTGVKPNTRDSKGRTPLHVAAFASHKSALAALVQIGADPNALEYHKYDIVTIAAVANDMEILELAVRLGCKPGNITSVYDGTALIAAAHLGHADIVRFLLTKEARVDHVNNLGWTALMEAVILGDGGERHINTLKALVDAGANKSIADRSGVTPLQHAQSRGYDKMIEILK